MYLFVAIVENGQSSIGQYYRMDLIPVMSHVKYGDCITICTIHPKNAYRYYLLHCKWYNLPQGRCYNMPQRHLAHEICNCRTIRCTLRLGVQSMRLIIVSNSNIDLTSSFYCCIMYVIGNKLYSIL